MSPTPYTANIEAAARFARTLIATEVGIQNKMWEDDNARADNANGELMCAAMASLDLVQIKEVGKLDSKTAVLIARDDFYPPNWSGFRDYGTRIANLVVAAAFIENEIKRCLVNGEDWTRAKREPDQTYSPATGLPAVSSEEASRVS
jgi:hypothetical protein